MNGVSTILDSRGQPFQVAGGARADGGVPAPDGTTRIPGLAGSSAYAYDASRLQTQEFGEWFPQIRSPDAEINVHRDRMVARSRDLARNSGWAAGGITRILDNVIGTHLAVAGAARLPRAGTSVRHQGVRRGLGERVSPGS